MSYHSALNSSSYDEEADELVNEHGVEAGDVVSGCHRVFQVQELDGGEHQLIPVDLEDGPLPDLVTKPSSCCKKCCCLSHCTIRSHRKTVWN